MIFSGWLFGWLVFAILVLMSLWAVASANYNKELKENYDLGKDNYNLKKKIDDLKEDNKFLKEAVMEFKGGELTKGELIKSVQALIDDEESERLKKITQKDKEL
jgi:hypothetical protein